MSSANSHSNLFSPDIKNLTRREVLKGLAAIPALSLIPELPSASPIPTNASEILDRIYSLTLDLAMYVCKVRAQAGDDLANKLDPKEVIRQFNKASVAAKEIDDLLISIPFDREILQPLCGGYERYTEAVWQVADEA